MEYDDLVLGAGMAGLTLAAELASDGRRVLVLEAHDVPGGNAHTFTVGDYRFCAQVHYIFGCGEGEPVHALLQRLGLEDEVRFHRLDPEGFDHVVVGGERTRICNGLEKYRERLVRRFPKDERPIRRYFDAILAIGRELDALPETIGWRDRVLAPFKFPHLLRMRSWTLQRLYDEVKMPARLQAILAGQCGDYLLPPAEVSLILHVSLVRAYDRGAYYPEKHFRHFIGAVASYIDRQPGCRVLLESEVDQIHVEKDRVTGVRTKTGRVFSARRYVSNVDPRRTAALVGARALPKKWIDRLGYRYSQSAITLYLGVRGIDLRAHGFGSWNVWHYASDDINAIYRRQERGDFSNPWLFMSTPTLHTSERGLCPEGDQILEIVTGAPYRAFGELRERDRKQYNREKKALRERLIALVEERYVPNLSKHVVMRVLGTPATNARYCWAPEGNAYGSELTPENVQLGRIPAETPLQNLWLVNASAGYPSIGGTVAAATQLWKTLRERD